MTHRHAPSLLALSALLLCTFTRSSSSASSELRGRNSSHGDPSAKNKQITGHNHGSHSTFVSEGGGLGPDEGVSPVCAYRVIEGGISGQLCFRRTLFGYKCLTEDCRTQVSLGTLVANVLTNGSVLLQWTHEGDSKQTSRDEKPPGAGPGPGSTRSSSVFRDRSHRRGGYELSCWWNGSYTQFECASVHLGSGCRDFLLSELHENIPYRICLRPLTRPEPDQRPADCVEFTLPTSGMQDIVIAMTTVGGAICVMLVIICLLVAYITENIMSPATKHTYYRTHPRH
ncbi:fibronectin type III domain-containing protein 10 [Nematolebias whitei]|uniref:fibronectin type III domain-containing protein 10 n=1 Tax=Nematolebias whitei TaxID=451745 RepID=UPI00189BDF6F|nr:fibronectin type III domain-containing protein 10 [Nematolebias whitei]